IVGQGDGYHYDVSLPQEVVEALHLPDRVEVLDGTSRGVDPYGPHVEGPGHPCDRLAYPACADYPDRLPPQEDPVGRALEDPVPQPLVVPEQVLSEVEDHPEDVLRYRVLVRPCVGAERDLRRYGGDIDEVDPGRHRLEQLDVRHLLEELPRHHPAAEQDKDFDVLLLRICQLADGTDIVPAVACAGDPPHQVLGDYHVRSYDLLSFSHAHFLFPFYLSVARLSLEWSRSR